MAFTVTEYVADTFDSLTDLGGGIWEVIYNLECPQTSFLEFKFNYVKSTSTKVNISAFFESSEAALYRKDNIEYSQFEPLKDVYFQETWVDKTTSTLYSVDHSEAGLARILIPVSMASARIKIRLECTIFSGTPSFEIFASEVNVKGNR